MCFRSQMRAETTTLLGPLERANFSHWVQINMLSVRLRDFALIKLLTLSVNSRFCKLAIPYPFLSLLFIIRFLCSALYLCR
jgi:hypothetical protein